MAGDRRGGRATVSDRTYARLMATHLEHVVEFFVFSKPPYWNEEIADKANSLRWEILGFLSEVEGGEDDTV